MRGFITEILIMFISYFAACTWPIYVYVLYGVKTTTVEVRVPFAGEKSDVELAVNVIMMTIIATYGGLAYIGMEVFNALCANIVNLLPVLVKCELKQLSDDYQKKSVTELELRIRFKNILEQSLDADK